MRRPKHIRVYKYFVCEISGEQCGDDSPYSMPLDFPTAEDCKKCIKELELEGGKDG